MRKIYELYVLSPMDYCIFSRYYFLRYIISLMKSLLFLCIFTALKICFKLSKMKVEKIRIIETECHLKKHFSKVK